MKQCQMWIKDKITCGKSFRCSKQAPARMCKLSEKRKVMIYLCDEHNVILKEAP